MISKQISDRIVVVGTDPGGKGGIATVIAAQKSMMESFNFIKLHQAGFRKFILPFTAFLKAFRYAPKKYAIVHIHTASDSDFYRNSPFVLLFKLLGKQVVLHIHGAEFERFHNRHRRLVEFICNKADALATVSTYFVNFLRREKLNPHVELLHNSISPTYPSAKKEKIPGAPTVMSYFGAITGRKGIFEVLEAIALCKQRLNTPITLRIGGNGEIQRLHDTISRLQLQDIVIFEGWLGEKEKTSLLEASDIFIHPSYFESFGISILEALAHGVPVITTSIGGISDLVTHNFNGIVVEPGNVEEIADAITFLTNNPTERKRLGENALRHSHNFYHAKIAANLMNIYQRLLPPTSRQ